MVSNRVAKGSEVLPWSHDKSMGGRGVVVRFTEGKTTVCLQVSDMISYPRPNGLVPSFFGRSPSLSSPSTKKVPGSRDIVPLPGIGRASKAARVQFSPPQSLMQPGLCPHHVSLVSVPHCAPASPGLLHPGLCLELSLGPTQLPGPHMLWRENMRTKGRAHGRTHLFPFLWVLCWVLPLFNPFPKASGVLYLLSNPILFSAKGPPLCVCHLGFY